MKHLKITGFGIVVLSLAMLAGVGLHKASAQTASPIERSQQVLAGRCDVLETRLKLTQKTELTSRIKRGRAYDQELLSFISAFNNRVTTNNVDAPELLRIAADLQAATGPSEFGHLYTVYADDLTSAISSDCEASPEITYGWVEKARIDRQALALKVKEIDALTNEYIAELAKLEKRFTPAINKPDNTSGRGNND